VLASPIPGTDLVDGFSTISARRMGHRAHVLFQNKEKRKYKVAEKLKLNI
jgi:hypothetical protein